MAAYALGDVQGCYNTLCRLIDKIKFDESKDELWFAGDLVNRGPDSVKVLRLAKSLRRTRVVLGNHDLHLLAVSEGFRKTKFSDTFDDVLNASDREELLHWLRHQPLLHQDKKRKVILVHAGLHPDWSIGTAVDCADKIASLLTNDETYPILLAKMYGNNPSRWSNRLGKFNKARWYVNVFTRMRFCTDSGELDFTQVGAPGTQPKNLHPWFTLRKKSVYRILFGHWSLLGASVMDRVISLDSGCVHGGKLSAVNIDQDPPRLLQAANAEG